MKIIDHQLLLVLGGLLISLYKGDNLSIGVLAVVWFVGMFYKRYTEAK